MHNKITWLLQQYSFYHFYFESIILMSSRKSIFPSIHGLSFLKSFVWHLKRFQTKERGKQFGGGYLTFSVPGLLSLCFSVEDIDSSSDSLNFSESPVSISSLLPFHRSPQLFSVEGSRNVNQSQTHKTYSEATTTCWSRKQSTLLDLHIFGRQCFCSIHLFLFLNLSKKKISISFA